MNLKDIKYDISDNCIHIDDSYKVEHKSYMEEFINYLRDIYDENSILENRTNESLITEWAGHNMLYTLGLFKSHTKDVDLDNESPIRMACYTVLSAIYDAYIFYRNFLK